MAHVLKEKTMNSNAIDGIKIEIKSDTKFSEYALKYLI